MIKLVLPHFSSQKATQRGEKMQRPSLRKPGEIWIWNHNSVEKQVTAGQVGKGLRRKQRIHLSEWDGEGHATREMEWMGWVEARARSFPGPAWVSWNRGVEAELRITQTNEVWGRGGTLNGETPYHDEQPGKGSKNSYTLLSHKNNSCYPETALAPPQHKPLANSWSRENLHHSNISNQQWTISSGVHRYKKQKQEDKSKQRHQMKNQINKNQRTFSRIKPNQNKNPQWSIYFYKTRVQRRNLRARGNNSKMTKGNKTSCQGSGKLQCHRNESQGERSTNETDSAETQ